MTMRIRTVVSVAAVAAAASFSAAAADIEAGKKKVQEVCAACHGIDGAQPTAPEYPKLAGQYPDYLAKALRDYKSGARKNPIMAGMAQGLSAKDIEDVSAYFYAQPGNLATRY
jgi:cytochrome c553